MSHSLVPVDKSAYRVERGVVPHWISVSGFRGGAYTVYKTDVANYFVQIYTNEEPAIYFWDLAYKGDEEHAYIGYGGKVTGEIFATFAECVDDINSFIARVNAFPGYFEKSRYDWHFKRDALGNTQQAAALLFENRHRLRLGLEVVLYDVRSDKYVIAGLKNYSRGTIYGGEDAEKIEELQIECCGDRWFAPRDISALDDFVDALQSEVGLTLVPTL